MLARRFPAFILPALVLLAVGACKKAEPRAPSATASSAAG